MLLSLSLDLVHLLAYLPESERSVLEYLVFRDLLLDDLRHYDLEGKREAAVFEVLLKYHGLYVNP